MRSWTHGIKVKYYTKTEYNYNKIKVIFFSKANQDDIVDDRTQIILASPIKCMYTQWD